MTVNRRASGTKATVHRPEVEEATLSWVRVQVNTDLSWVGWVGRRGVRGEQIAGNGEN